MEVGLLHLHRTLAYIIFVVALVDVVLVLSKARTDPKVARVLFWAHKLGLLMAGRVTILAGLGMWAVWPTVTLGTWWLWVSLLLWGPVEAFGARFVTREVRSVLDGGTGSARMVLGVVIQLLCVVTIFGLMSAPL